jgi:hypothetical protein
VSAAQYRGLFLAHPQSIVGNLIWYRDQLAHEFGWGSLALAAVGVVAWFRDPSRRAYGGLLAFIFVADVSFAICYNVFDAYVFFLPSYLVVAALLTVGAGASADLACRSLRLGEDVRARVYRAAMPVALGVALVQMSFHYAANDKSGNFLEADFSRNLLLSAPPRTLLIAQGSMLFSLWYREFALHERRDVTVVSADMFKAVADRGHWYARHLERCDPSLRPLLGSPGLSRVPADSLLVALVANALGEGRPVLFVGNGAFEASGETSGDFTPAEVMLSRAFVEAPWGLAYRLYPKGRAPRTGDLVAATAPLWERFRTRGVYDGWAHNDPLQEHIARRYAQGGVSFAKLAERAGRFDLADAAYTRASLLYQIPDADAGRARCAEHLRRSAQAANARPVTPRE